MTRFSHGRAATSWRSLRAAACAALSLAAFAAQAQQLPDIGFTSVGRAAPPCRRHQHSAPGRCQHAAQWRLHWLSSLWKDAAGCDAPADQPHARHPTARMERRVPPAAIRPAQRHLDQHAARAGANSAVAADRYVQAATASLGAVSVEEGQPVLQFTTAQGVPVLMAWIRSPPCPPGPAG